MFDTFRGDVLCTGMESWTAMDAKAASSIERCMRMCKFKMNKNTVVNVVSNFQTHNFEEPFWSMQYAHGDSSVLSRIYSTAGKKQIAFANLIQSNIMSFPLPRSVSAQQANSLKRIYGACDFSMNAARYFHICSMCVVNGKVSLMPQILYLIIMQILTP